jgi:hypothetical protein
MPFFKSIHRAFAVSLLFRLHHYDNPCGSGSATLIEFYLCRVTYCTYRTRFFSISERSTSQHILYLKNVLITLEPDLHVVTWFFFSQIILQAGLSTLFYIRAEYKGMVSVLHI